MNAIDCQAELEALRERLLEEDDILVAIAFGSLTRGEARQHSDVDIGVLASRPLTAERRRELLRSVGERIGRPVDLVDLRNAGVSVLREILRNGKRLVCRDRRAYDALISRLLVDTEDFLPYRERMLRERRKAWIH